MTDYAAALRFVAALAPTPARAPAICYEAAREIDRLRAEIARLREALATMLQIAHDLSLYDNHLVAMNAARAALAPVEVSE